MSKPKDIVPAGVCTAIGCRCSCFASRENSLMYCMQPNCGHSVEHHHIPAKEIRDER